VASALGFQCARVGGGMLLRVVGDGGAVVEVVDVVVSDSVVVRWASVVPVVGMGEVGRCVLVEDEGGRSVMGVVLRLSEDEYSERGGVGGGWVWCVARRETGRSVGRSTAGTYIGDFGGRSCRGGAWGGSTECSCRGEVGDAVDGVVPADEAGENMGGVTLRGGVCVDMAEAMFCFRDEVGEV
jgi:hypothetical protein